MSYTHDDCPCWVGHGDCGGCSGYPGISHEPACGWEWNPECPEHKPVGEHTETVSRAQEVGKNGGTELHP